MQFQNSLGPLMHGHAVSYYVCICLPTCQYVVSLASFFSPFEIQLYLFSISHTEPIRLNSDQNIYLWKTRTIFSQKLLHSDLAFYFYFSERFSKKTKQVQSTTLILIIRIVNEISLNENSCFLRTFWQKGS